MNRRQQLIAWILALLALSVLVAGYRATLTPVTLIVDGHTRHLRTHQPTVSLLLADLGLSLRPEDRVSPTLMTLLKPQTIIRITHARPVVIVVDGYERTLYTQEKSPADLLAQAGVAMNNHDTMQMAPPQSVDPPDTRYRLIVQRAHQVILEENGVSTPFYTHAATVGEALLSEGIQLYRADHLSPDAATPIEEGMHIYLDRSLPVTVQVDGHELRTRTHRSRVGEVLADLGVTLNGEDYAVPPLDASLGEGGVVRVVRVTESILIEQSPIPFDSEWRADPTLEIDHQQLLQEGSPGVLEKRIRLRYEDGQVVSRNVEGESIVQAPVNRVMGYGTKIVVRQLQTPNGTIEYWRVLRMLATSYSAGTAGVSPSNPHYGSTATGLPMSDGIVAVDPHVIPLLSKVYIPGYGIGLAADTGGAIRGKRIDLGYSDEHLQLWFSWVNVYLLTPVPDQINYLGP